MPKKKTKPEEKQFDAKSAEVADVAQGEDEKQDPPETESPPERTHTEQRLADLEEAVVKLASRHQEIGEAGAELESKLLDLKAYPAKLQEKIAAVGSEQSAGFANLSDRLDSLEADHHDRLLELESRTAAEPEAAG